MRFNPPPNWPPVPPGWTPGPDWQPDPSWPPPPAGWPLWVPSWGEASGAPLPVGPAGGGPGNAPRKGWWIALAVTAVVVVVGLVGALAVGLGIRRHTAGAPPAKPDITTLSEDMLVDRSDFPSSAGTEWISKVFDNGAQARFQRTSNPAECVEPGTADGASQTGVARLGVIQVKLVAGAEPQDLEGFVQNCASYSVTMQIRQKSVTVEMSVKPLQVAEVPRWAVAATLASEPSGPSFDFVAGYYRGVLVLVSSAKPDRADDLAKLFNTQVDRLAAVPD